VKKRRVIEESKGCIKQNKLTIYYIIHFKPFNNIHMKKVIYVSLLALSMASLSSVALADRKTVGTGDDRKTVGTGDDRKTVGTGDDRKTVGTGDDRKTVGTGD
jgi:hypothetical protein